MSTHNTRFHGEIRKILYGYPLISGAMTYGRKARTQLEWLNVLADLGLPYCLPIYALRFLFACSASNIKELHDKKYFMN